MPELRVAPPNHLNLRPLKVGKSQLVYMEGWAGEPLLIAKPPSAKMVQLADARVAGIGCHSHASPFEILHAQPGKAK